MYYYIEVKVIHCGLFELIEMCAVHDWGGSRTNTYYNYYYYKKGVLHRNFEIG